MKRANRNPPTPPYYPISPSAAPPHVLPCISSLNRIGLERERGRDVPWDTLSPMQRPITAFSKLRQYFKRIRRGIVTTVGDNSVRALERGCRRDEEG